MKLHLHCGQEWILANLTLLPLPCTLCSLRSGVLSPLYTGHTPALYFPPSQQLKLPPISHRSLKPYMVNSQPPFLLTQNLFLSSPIFCLFLFLVSEPDCLEKPSSGFHTSPLSATHLLPIFHLSSSELFPVQLTSGSKLSFPKNTFPWPCFSSM